MVDCVGFTVSDAYGYSEGDEERMVKTPWFYEDVPFEEADCCGNAESHIRTFDDRCFGDYRWKYRRY